MADRTRTITLTVKDDFSRQLSDFARKVEGAGGAVDGIAKKNQDLGRTADKFNEIAQAAQTLFNWGKAAVGEVIALANEGIKIEQTAASFEKLAGGAKQAEEWIGAIQGASRGSLTDFEATTTAIQLMTMGLVDSADEAARFMEVAQITKAINPELGTMENTIKNIGLTLANDSFMRLDQLGVDAMKLKERMKELEEQGIEATEAFDIGVLEQMEENAAIIGTEVLEIGRNTTEMQTQWRELKEAASEFALVITEKISPAITDAIKLTTEFVQGWSDLLSGKVDNLSGYDTGNKEDIQAYIDAIPDEAWSETEWSALATALQSQTENTAEFEALMSYYAQLSFEQKQALLTLMLTPGAGPQPFTYTPPQLTTGGSGIQTNMREREGTGTEGIEAFKWLSADYQPPAYLDNTPRFAPSMSALLEGTAPPSGIWGDIFSGIGDTIEGGFEKGKNAAADFYGMVRDKADEMNEEQAKAMEEYMNQSVLTRFGATATGFDKDVLTHMNNALSTTDISAEEATIAMENFQMMTNQATGATMLFDDQLERLSANLASGQIDATTYAQEVAKLSQMDLSTFNEMITGMVAGGDFEGAREYLDYLSSMDLSQLQAMIDVNKTTTEEGEKESQFQTMIDDAQSAEEEITKSAETIRDEYIASLNEVQTQGGEEFKTLAETSIDYMTQMQDTIRQFNMMDWSFTATAVMNGQTLSPSTTSNAGGEGMAHLPEYAEGGFTGTGGSPFMALLHPNELVIPMHKLNQGRGGDGQSLKVDLYIDGRQVEASVGNVRRLKNEGW